MSRTTIWNIYKTKATIHSELSNAWLSAPPLWNFLCSTYLEGKNWLQETYTSALWDLWKNSNVPVFLRCSLLMTFDKGVVLVDDLPDAAEYCRHTHHFLGNNSHWNSIAEALADIWMLHDYRLFGVGLGCTSVSDPWWGYNKNQWKELFSVIDSVNEIK